MAEYLILLEMSFWDGFCLIIRSQITPQTEELEKLEQLFGNDKCLNSDTCESVRQPFAEKHFELMDNTCFFEYTHHSFFSIYFIDAL